MKIKLLLAACLVLLQMNATSAVTIGTNSTEAEQALLRGDFGQAGKLYKDLLKSAGDDLSGAQVFDDYAWLMQGKGKLDDAATYANRALTLRRKLLPADAAQIAQSLAHLGELDEAQGLTKEALDLYLQAYKGCAAGSIMRANLAEQVAITQMKMGNSAAAAQYCNHSLEDKHQIGAVGQRYSNPLSDDTVFYRYAAGAPNCSRAAVDGESLATISAEGVTVQATVVPASDFQGMTAYVRVINQGHGPIDFLPEPPFMILVKPEFKIVTKASADKIAEDIQKKGNRKANLIRFFQGDATTTVSSTVMTSGNPGWGGYPYGAWGAYPYQRRNYGSQMTIVNTQVPDWQARARAEARAQEATARAAEAAAAIRNQKLLAQTLPPGQMTEGTVQFNATKVQQGYLRIPIGNAVFEFPFGQ